MAAGAFLSITLTLLAVMASSVVFGAGGGLVIRGAFQPGTLAAVRGPAPQAVRRGRLAA